MLARNKRNTAPATKAASQRKKLIDQRKLRLTKLWLILINECRCSQELGTPACKEGNFGNLCVSKTSLAKTMSTFDLYIKAKVDYVNCDKYLNKRSWQHSEIKRLINTNEGRDIAKHINIDIFTLRPRGRES